MKGRAYDVCLAALKEKNIFAEKNKSVKKLSSILIGETAELFVSPDSVEKFAEAVKIIKELQLRYCVLSGGSNTLFCSDILRTVLLSTRRLVGTKLSGNELEIFAGTTAGDAIRFCRQNDLSALESFVGVPSRIGGMVAMNFGCYGKEMSDGILSVTAITENGVETIAKKDCGFSYRSSRFLSGEVVLSVRLAAKICQAVGNRCNAVFAKRLATQPLSKPSLGCVFKSDKIQVGKAVEELNLKGKRVGDAEISVMHGGFIINRGRATSKEVLKLMDIVREKVYNNLETELQTEIKKVF